MTDTTEKALPPEVRIRICEKGHGSPGNEASVYGHHGSIRTCIRMYGTDTWLFDPRWEARR